MLCDGGQRAGLLWHGGQRAGAAGRVRIVEPFLDDLADLVTRRYQLEYAAVHLPIPELFRLKGVMAEVGDVQPVAQIVEHDAAVATERAHRPGLPQRLHLLGSRSCLRQWPVAGSKPSSSGGGQAANSTTSASVGPIPAS